LAPDDRLRPYLATTELARSHLPRAHEEFRWTYAREYVKLPAALFPINIHALARIRVCCQGACPSMDDCAHDSSSAVGIGAVPRALLLLHCKRRAAPECTVCPRLVGRWLRRSSVCRGRRLRAHPPPIAWPRTAFRGLAAGGSNAQPRPCPAYSAWQVTGHKLDRGRLRAYLGVATRMVGASQGALEVIWPSHQTSGASAERVLANLADTAAAAVGRAHGARCPSRAGRFDSSSTLTCDVHGGERRKNSAGRRGPSCPTVGLASRVIWRSARRSWR
jgi:hypothetical protein